jgi:hypothetical protein
VSDVPDRDAITSRRIEEIDARLAEIVSTKWQLADEQWRLEDERTLLVRSRSGSHRDSAGPHEWRPERVRDVLLWLGVVLLALAAVTFTAVAWSRLGNTGRAGLLVGATVVVAAATGATRRRLPATAEALGALTLVLMIVDWFAARRAGVGSGLSIEVAAALGTGIAAGAAFAFALRWNLRVGRVAVAALGPVTIGLLLPAVAGATWAEGLSGALVAAALAVGAFFLWDRHEWRRAAQLLFLGTIVFELWALVAALTGMMDVLGFIFEEPGTTAELLAPASAIAAIGLAPALIAALARNRLPENWRFDLLVALAAAAALGATLVVTALLDPDDRWTIAAELGASAIVATAVLPGALRRGVVATGSLFIGIAIATQLPGVSTALVGPLAWATDPWSGELGLQSRGHLGPGTRFTAHYASLTVPLIAALAATVAAVPIRGRPRLIPEDAARMAVVVLGVAAGACAPLVVGVSIATTIDIEATAATALLIAGLVAERRRPHWSVPCLAGAALLAVPAIGWSLVTRPLTAVFLAGVVVIVGTASFVARSARVRAATAVIAGSAALARVCLAVAHDADDLGPAGPAVALTGGVLLLAGVLGRRATPEGTALEATGLLGLLAGAFLGGASLTWLAATFTVAVPTLALAAFRRDRRAYAWAAIAVAVAATWAWLAAADVELMEAYTLPAGAAALSAGIARHRLVPRTGSWIAYGPAITTVLGPSTALAVVQGGALRPVTVTAAGLLVVILGARSRLQAPLVLGGCALVALAVDILGPVAVRVPRWTALGAAGLVLLWLGSTAERRLAEARRLRATVEQFA